MNEKNNGNNNNNKYDFVNSRALFVLKIITMSFAIFACVVIVTALLTRWIMDLNQKIKESNTKIARAAARLDKFRRLRVKHIMKQRKLQVKEEKKNKKKKYHARDKKLMDMENDGIDEMDEDDIDDLDDIDGITDEENALNDFDHELSDILLENIDGEL